MSGNENKKQYSKEFKEKVIKRLEPPTNQTVPQIAKELSMRRPQFSRQIKHTDING